jgi:hypothetical protein
MDTLAYYNKESILPVKSIIEQAPGAWTVKHYGFVKNRFRSKLVYSIAYYEICPFSVNYESAMFYSTGPWSFFR